MVMCNVGTMTRHTLKILHFEHIQPYFNINEKVIIKSDLAKMTQIFNDWSLFDLQLPPISGDYSKSKQQCTKYVKILVSLKAENK